MQKSFFMCDKNMDVSTYERDCHWHWNVFDIRGITCGHSLFVQRVCIWFVLVALIMHENPLHLWGNCWFVFLSVHMELIYSPIEVLQC